MPSSTSNSESNAAKAGLPIALLATLLAFAACESWIWSYKPWLELCARYAPPYRASDPLRTSVRIRLLPKEEPQPAVLLVGSSQILEGLDCEPFEERFSGRTCRNLGIAGGTPLDLLFLADRIDRRVARRVLVTGLFPQTLHSVPKAAFSDTRTLRCLLETGAWLHLSAKEWIEVVAYGQIQNFSETLRLKDSLWDMWDVVGPDPVAALRLEIPPPPRRTLDSKPPQPPGFFQEAMGRVNTGIAPGPFTGAHEKALFEVIERESRRGNRMIVIDFPTRRGYATTITPEAVEHHQRLLKRVAAWPNVAVVSGEELPPLGDHDFHDFTHVRASGRRKLSERIAEILARVEG